MPPPYPFIQARTNLMHCPNSAFARICLTIVAIKASQGHAYKKLEMAVGHSQPILKRCVSLSSGMDLGGRLFDPSGYTKRASVYSPAHSPPPELAQKDGGMGLEKRPVRSDEDYSTRQYHPTAEVYTKIQTQLYPQMRF